MRVPILLAVLSSIPLLQVGSSNKGVEQRLEKMTAHIEKLIKPRWHFWLPIAISTVIAIAALIVAILAWQRPVVQAPASSGQTHPSTQSTATPTSTPPPQESPSR